ncbi:27376_t:CDS:2 [Racocetra persica]|uniref:27376_t:CDS:1 n=1 Tax=Racocetra persica TaxID=160502 RepID=A0ACA9K981_9GLOM|nr:27376_t:CDS:2 [Racocetra persica]
MVRQRSNNGTAVSITKRTLKSTTQSSSSAQAGPRGRKSNVGAVSSTKKSTTNGKSRSKKITKNDSHRKRGKPDSGDEFYQSDDTRDDIDVDDNVTINTISNDGSHDMEDLIGVLQTRTSKKSNSRFNKFEREQETRLQEAMELINGENGVVNVWVSEMKNIALSVMKKMDEKLNNDSTCIKNLKLEFEKYQSVTTETLDHLAKIHTQSQRFRRELDNELKRLYTTDEAELNESLDHFIKDQRQVRKSLAKSNKSSIIAKEMNASKSRIARVGLENFRIPDPDISG